MKSMTGFGFTEGEDATCSASVQIKSLNARFFDLTCSLPSSLSLLESRIRKKMQEVFYRGRLELTIHARDKEKKISVQVNPLAAEVWKNAFKNLAEFLGKKEEISLDFIVRQEAVLEVTQPRKREDCWPFLEDLLSKAIEQVQHEREREGLFLAQDMNKSLHELEKSFARIREGRPQVRATIEARLRDRFKELIGDEVGEQRLLVEMAAWIIKNDIHEELVRFEAHITAFREALASKLPIGKRLDFLVQEMLREVNTMGSKNSQADLSLEVVNMKESLEKLREQLRNVE